MGILSGLRQGLAVLRTLARPPQPGEVEEFSFGAEVPVGGVEAPLWRIQVQLSSEPHGDGEKLRLRAHIQTNLASALRPALASPQTARAALPGTGMASLGQRASALAQRGAARALRVPLVRTLAEPLLEHDLNTWIEINASTASLDQGSRELLPQGERLAALGIRPRATVRGDRPAVETWAGESPGGFAQVSLLQMDKEHLPPQLAQALGEQPFQLAAAIVNTIERK